jgi:hypothetical protein
MSLLILHFSVSELFQNVQHKAFKKQKSKAFGKSIATEILNSFQYARFLWLSFLGTVTRLGAGVSGVRTLAEGKIFFFLSKTSRPALGLIQPPTQWISRDFSLRAKAAGA